MRPDSEDQSHGGALLRRGDCGTWCRSTLSVVLEHLPNALTAVRIAAVSVLAWLAIGRFSSPA